MDQYYTGDYSGDYSRNSKYNFSNFNKIKLHNTLTKNNLLVNSTPLILPS